MTRRWSQVGNAAVCGAIAVTVYLGIAGCTSQPRSTTSAGPAVIAESTAPPVPVATGATLSGYLTGTGSASESGDDAKPGTRYTITVTWGRPRLDKQSDLLLIDSIVVELGGTTVPAGGARDKIAAIDRYVKQGWNVHPATVSYEASAGAGVSDSTEEGYPNVVATRVVVGPVK